jgi:hypothetical protein
LFELSDGWVEACFHMTKEEAERQTGRIGERVPADLCGSIEARDVTVTRSPPSQGKQRRVSQPARFEAIPRAPERHAATQWPDPAKIKKTDMTKTAPEHNKALEHSTTHCNEGAQSCSAALLPVVAAVAVWGATAWGFLPPQQARLVGIVGLNNAPIILSLKLLLRLGSGPLARHRHARHDPTNGRRSCPPDVTVGLLCYA